MADTSQQELSEPHTNGAIDGLTEEEKSKMRPADIDADMREMERRKRVEMMMNSRLFREELERIIETQMKDGAGPSGLLQQISEMMGPQGARFNANVFKNSNCVVPINDIRGVESMGYAKGEKMLRCKLAAVFRLLDLYGWTQGVGGQITARLNQDQEHFLVNPYGLLYHEVTASSLVKVDMQGAVVEQGTTNFGVHVSGFQLHSTIHAARPDIKCIVHIATPSVTAISSMKCGLLPLGQESIVIGEVSNHQYIGGIFEPEEREKITRNLGPVNKVMLITNRGALCCGETVEEAFFNVYNTVLACETQLKLMPAGLDNINLISEESKKAIFEASRKPPVPQPSSVAEPSPLAEKLEKRWRIGGTEFEALMRMLDNAGFRTGYIYRHPLVKSEPPRPRNDVEVPPAVSSLGYLLEEEELYKQGLWKGGRKGTDRTRWLNSPNVYQKVEILETGTPDPKKITKWVDQNAEEWVTDGSPTHSSTPVRIESALQFVPKNTNPKEFKQLQQQIKDYRRADKISAGPQSHILEGVTWEEAKKMQDATISGTGEQVVLVGAASKGIIQRGFQHNAMVYKTPYAKNPFDAVTDQELDQYKKDVERKQKGDPYDESQSESEALSSFNVSRATHESSTAKSPIQSPISVTSETEEESRDEPKVLRIATKQVPVPSQPEVVLSDDQSVEPKVVETPLMQQTRIEAQRMPQKTVTHRITAVDATTEFLNEMRRSAIEPRNNVSRRDYGQSSTCSSENQDDIHSSWQSSEFYEKPHLEVARTTTVAEVMKPVLMTIPTTSLQSYKLKNNAVVDKNSCSFRKPKRCDILKRAFLDDYDKRINQSSQPPVIETKARFVNAPKVNERNFLTTISRIQPPCDIVFNSLTNEDKSLKNKKICTNSNISSNLHGSLSNGDKMIGSFENVYLRDKKLNNATENPRKINQEIQDYADLQNGSNIFTEKEIQAFKNTKNKTDHSLKNNEEHLENKNTELKRKIANLVEASASRPKKRCARKLNIQTKFVSRSAEDVNSAEDIGKETKSKPLIRSIYVDSSINTDPIKIDFSKPERKAKKEESKVKSKEVITVDCTIDRRPEMDFTQQVNINLENQIESNSKTDLSPEALSENLQAPILVLEVLQSSLEKDTKEISVKEIESDLKPQEAKLDVPKNEEKMKKCQISDKIDQSQTEENTNSEKRDNENDFIEVQGQVELEEVKEHEEDFNGNHSDENGNLWNSVKEEDDQFCSNDKFQKAKVVIDLIHCLDDNLNVNDNKVEASKTVNDFPSEEISEKIIEKETEESMKEESQREIAKEQENGKKNEDEFLENEKMLTNMENDKNNKVSVEGNFQDNETEDEDNLNNENKANENKMCAISKRETTGYDGYEHFNYMPSDDKSLTNDENKVIEEDNILINENKDENLNSEVFSETGNKKASGIESDSINNDNFNLKDFFSIAKIKNSAEEGKDSQNEFLLDEIKALRTQSEECLSKPFSETETLKLNDLTELNDPCVNGKFSEKTKETVAETEDESLEEKQQKKEIPTDARENESLREIFLPNENKKMTQVEKQSSSAAEELENFKTKMILITESKEIAENKDFKLSELSSDEHQISGENKTLINDKSKDSPYIPIILLDETPENEVLDEKSDFNLNEIFPVNEKEIVTEVKESESQEDDSTDIKENEDPNDNISSHDQVDVKYEDFVNEMFLTEGEKSSFNTKTEEDFNLNDMFLDYENKAPSESEYAKDSVHEIFENTENFFDEILSTLNTTHFKKFEAFTDNIFSLNEQDFDLIDLFSAYDNKIVIEQDQDPNRDIEYSIEKDSLDEEIMLEDNCNLKTVFLPKGGNAVFHPDTKDIRNNIELVPSTSSSKCLGRSDSITDMINNIDVNIPHSKTTYENLPDTNNSLKYNLDPTNMSLIYSLTPSADVVSGKAVSSKNTSIEMMGFSLGSLEDLDQLDPFKVVKHDLFDWLDLASVKTQRIDFYLQQNTRLINSCPNLDFFIDLLNGESFSEDGNHSNQGSDILELPSSTYLELKETEEESFCHELNSTVNQILVDLEKTEVYTNATNLVDDILYDISCLNIIIDVKNLKQATKLLMQDRIYTVFVVKDILRRLICELPCYKEREDLNVRMERSLEPIVPVNTPADNKEAEKAVDFESSIIVIEEIVHHIIDKFVYKTPEVYSPKRLKETMNTGLKNCPDFKDDQDEEKKIQEEHELARLFRNIHDNDILPCVCSECLPTENLESAEVQKDQESLKDFLNLVNENESQDSILDESDFKVTNLNSGVDQNLQVLGQELEIQDQKLETQNQDLAIQEQKLEVHTESKTLEDFSGSDTEDHDVLNLKSKIIKMFALDKEKSRKCGSLSIKYQFNEPLDLKFCEDQTESQEKSASSSNSSPSDIHSTGSYNFPEHEVVSESTDNDTKSDNSREKEVSNKFEPFTAERIGSSENLNEDQEFNRLWLMRENKIEETCQTQRLRDLEKSPSFVHFGEIDEIEEKPCPCCIDVCSIDVEEDSPCKLPPIEEMNESVEFGNPVNLKSSDQTLASPRSPEYFTCKDESGSTLSWKSIAGKNVEIDTTKELVDKLEDPFEENNSDENDIHNATYTLSEASDSDKNEDLKLELEYSADVSSNLEVRKSRPSVSERMKEDKFYDTTLNFADVSASTMFSELEVSRLRKSKKWMNINNRNYYSLACDNLESSREVESSLDEFDIPLLARPDKNPADYMSYSFDTREFIKLEKRLKEQDDVICCDLKNDKGMAPMSSLPKYEDTSLYRVVTQIDLADTASLPSSSFRDDSHNIL